MQTELTRRQHNYLRKIQASAQNLLGIINDILDFSKIEAGKLEMESLPFDLNTVLDNLATLINVRAEEKDLEIILATDADVPTALVGDPLRLEQVLVNLGTNAVKFTDEGEIVFSTKLLSEIDGRVTLQFTARDTGIGMSKEQISRLFKAFSQADVSITRRYGGTGLGLTISKQLVEMMEGEIWVQSQPGKGSIFTFTAVFGHSAEKEGVPLMTAEQLRDLRVMVVDDNPTARETFRSYLESSSLAVIVAASGEESLEMLETANNKEEPCNLVILDWKLPGIDGIEVARRIKEHPELYNTPTIIMVTAGDREEVRQQAQELGIISFLGKPFSQSTLLNAIMRVFGSQPLERDRYAAPPEWKVKDVEILRGARILLAEDNEINQEVAKGILEMAGVVVDITNNGVEAIEALERSRYDAVLMDIQMPVMDGYEATRTIRNDPRFADLPIISMTAHAMAGDREKSLEAGMNDHVTKPIDPDKLFTALTKWVEPGKRDVPERPEEEFEEIEPQPDDLLPVDLPGLAVNSGLARVGGNQKLYRSILRKFHTSQAGVVEEIKHALEEDDTDQAMWQAHTLKGVAGNIGAVGLQDKAQALEAALRHDDHAALDELLVQVDRSLSEVLDSISSLEVEEAQAQPVSEITGGEETADLNILAPLLRELAGYLEDNDTEALEITENMRELVLPPDLQAALRQLERLIGQYNFEGALDRLAQMAKDLNIELKGGQNGG